MTVLDDAAFFLKTSALGTHNCSFDQIMKFLIGSGLGPYSWSLGVSLSQLHGFVSPVADVGLC